MATIDILRPMEAPAAAAPPWPGAGLPADLAHGLGRLLDRLLVVLVVLAAPLGLAPLAPALATAALAWLLPAATAVTVLRLGLAWHGRRTAAGRPARTVVVVGAGEQGRRFVEHLARRDGPARLIGVFDDRATRVPGWVGAFPVLGTIDDLVDFARVHRVDEVVLALPWTAEARITTCLERLARVPAAVRLCPDLVAYRLTGRAVDTTHGIPLIEVQALPFTGTRRLVKAVLDRTLAALALALALPLVLLLAAAVRVTGRGPVLPAEDWHDFEGRALRLHAFAARPGTLGALLDQTGLGRLPRLLDVLAGRIALVGPRPHGPGTSPAVRRLVDDALARYRVRPGLIGLADLAHEDEPRAVGEHAAIDRRLLLDRAYVERWSPLLDLQVLARAVL
jgi:lipopolysaccharide/colanic/teichoic acid biosynthesis glycosyltransferase